MFFYLLLFNTIQPDAAPIEVHQQIARAAFEQVGVTIDYSPGYVRLKYPNGDVPQEGGVCTDVIVRAFRRIGIDLQKEIHLDMSNHFAEYPKLWNLKIPDPNIDHRRVPNQMKYFQRHEKSVPIQAEYKPGDVVAWRLSNGLYHIGIVSNEPVPGEKHHFMVHNIGEGARLEDVLFVYKIIGHYRW
jgi:uncharacterized protein YijF (DUF1287 family)